MKKHIIGLTITLLVSVLMCLLVLTGCQSNKNIQPVNITLLNEAVDYGKKNHSLTVFEFFGPWMIDKGYESGKGQATLCTPFLRAALVSRNAEENHQSIDLDIVKKVYLEETKTIHFFITVYGDDPTFERRVKAYLMYGNRKIDPLSLYLPPYSEFARDYTNSAKGDVKFSRDGIPDNATVNLVLETASNPSLSTKLPTVKTEYTFTLSKYR